jgi:predicted DNA-binding protein with PD1-like motif
VTIGSHRSDKSRHLVLRLAPGAHLPDDLGGALRQEEVACGWVRAGGVITDVELRAYDPVAGGPGEVRRIGGPWQAVTLEGSIGLSEGQPTTSLRAVLARDGARGLETVAGEIVSARAVAVEVFVTALDDVALQRSTDAAGVSLLGPTPAGGRAPAAVPWSGAIDASDRAEPRPRAPPQSTAGSAMPARLPRPARDDSDSPLPEPGDSVEHFAFGRCEVIKSDGDRLHIRVPKDGRVCEIALGMLRVSRVPDGDDGQHRFKLERRM